jgi:CheY-like chemotaxis protein
MSYISMDKMGLGRGVDKNLKKFEPENNSLEENFKLLKSVENYLSQIQDNLHSDPLKAWVVDDDPLILKAMSLCTKKTPIDVRTFESPIDLLDAFKKEQKPDILLSDFHMPCFDGLKLLKEVRKLDFEMPMLMLSADSDNESVAKAISLGADGYLFKPFRKDDLMVGIRQAILSAQITSGLSL